MQKTTSGVTNFVEGLFEDGGGVKTVYVYAGGQRVAAINNGSVFVYHGDHLGGTNVITASDGLKKELIEYLPYGKTFVDQKVNANQTITNYYFTGQYLDPESSLYYYGARYYNADVGRFISADTVVPDPGNPQSLNRYAYALNNPLRYMDPSGHEYQLSGALWYDKLSSWVSQVTEEAKSAVFANMPANTAGVIGATLLTTTMDFGMGVFHYPSSLGHLGEGSGTFLSNPSWETAPGMLMDVSVTSGLLAGAMAPLVNSGEETVSIFRAVSKAELEDINVLGKFRPHPEGLSLEAKQFGLNVDEIIKLSGSLEGSSSILKVRIPQTTFRQLDLTHVDSSILKSGTVSAQPGKQLNLLNDTIRDIQQLR